MRYVVALGALAVFTVAAYVAHREAAAAQVATRNQWVLQAPPLSIADFIEGVIGLPGFLIAIPFILLGAILGLEWLFPFGIGFGAVFFWYCVGWYFDCESGRSDREKPPRFIRKYMELMGILSLGGVFIGVLEVFHIGDYDLMPVPAFVTQVATSGITLTWSVIGVFLLLRNRRTRKQEAARHP